MRGPSSVAWFRFNSRRCEKPFVRHNDLSSQIPTHVPLANLMSALPVEPQHVVIYVIAPPSVCSSLKSPALRAIIMSQNRVSKLPGQYNVDQNRVLVHFVPDYFVTDPHTHPTTRHVGLEQFVNSVYNRLLRPTLRQTSRKFWEYNPAFENRFQVPAYVLARKTPPQTRLEWSEEPSLNTLDRHNFLQVGYRLSECKNWLLAACTDERGEAHDVAVWAVPHQNDCPSLNVNWIVSNVWIFATQFAQRAHTEWRIVISKLGNMGENEVEGASSATRRDPIECGLFCSVDISSGDNCASPNWTDCPRQPRMCAERHTAAALVYLPGQRQSCGHDNQF